MSDLSQTAANVLLVSGETLRKTAGATITAGSPIYFDAADSNKVKACKADAAGTANCDGIALCGASNGQPIVVSRGDGVINLGGTLTVGATYYVSSANAGKITGTPGDITSNQYVTVLGVALTSANLDLDIINSGTAKP